jgi:hypothetical protein
MISTSSTDGDTFTAMQMPCRENLGSGVKERIANTVLLRWA